MIREVHGIWCICLGTSFFCMHIFFQMKRSYVSFKLQSLVGFFHTKCTTSCVPALQTFNVIFCFVDGKYDTDYGLRGESVATFIEKQTSQTELIQTKGPIHNTEKPRRYRHFDWFLTISALKRIH